MKVKNDTQTSTVNPEENANCISRSVFWWMWDTLWKGYWAPLETTDVFPCHTRMRSKTMTEKLRVEWDKEKIKTSPSLAKAMLRANSKMLLWITFLSLIEAFFLTAPTVLVGKVASYFGPASLLTMNDALIFGCILASINATYVILRNYLFWELVTIGPMLGIQTSTLIYDKVCRISSSALSKTSIGHVITLVTNDAERFNDGLPALHATLDMPLVLSASFVLSYFTIGLYGTLAAFLALAVSVPLQFYIGKGVQFCRRKAVPYTDKRIKLIGETIASMKVIKMYKWESVFRDYILKIRQLEVKYIGIFMILKSSIDAIMSCSPIVGLLTLLIIKYFTEEPITSEMVFFFMAMGNLLQSKTNWGLGAAFLFIPQYSHSIGRFQKFLLLEEQDIDESSLCIKNQAGDCLQNGHLKSTDQTTEDSISVLAEDSDVAVQISGMTCSWWGENSFILSDITMTIKRKSLVGILGPVGSGKSSIIMSIIREMDILRGSVRCPYSSSYYSQVPWIFNGSVQENILLNRPLDKEKLYKTIDSCYLFQDLKALPNGLDTIVGERGVQLSGGQRARVSLARMVYGEEEVVLLDDPLSAVDTKCANHIFNKLIKGQLKDKTVILVTHNTEYLSKLDYIYVMGKAESEGENIVGRITHHGTWDELHDKDVLKEQVKLREDEQAEKKDQDEKEDKKGPKPDRVKEDRKTGLIDKRMYLKFWSLAFGPITFPLIILMVVGTQALKILHEQQALIWVERVDLDELGSGRATKTFIIYILLGVGAIFMCCVTVFFIALAGIISSRALHNMAFNGVLASPIRFFDITPIGILINRFAKDTFFCDERLSFVFTKFTTMLIGFLASMIVLCIANYYFLLVLLPLMAVMGFVLIFYLKSSVEVRRVEALERSPLMSHISGTLTGICTIRAFKQINVYREQYYKLRDRHTSAQMIFKATERWLSVRLDAIVTLMGFFATIMCIYFRDVIGAKLAGLGIVYIQNRLGAFQWCIRMGAECENLMTAVERIFSLVDLPPEEDPKNARIASTTLETENKTRSETDPLLPKTSSVVLYNGTQTRSASGTVATYADEGVLEFREVSLRYAPSLPFVLNGINFKTKPYEKIGIVGRTGAGKSSLIQALYRMYEVQGEIYIDGLDTSTQTLSELRGSISVIPQESLLFSGTLRDNLDPYHAFTDEVLWNALEQVQLKPYVTGKGGLLTPIEEMGGNMSVGQRQLLCLARALLKKSSLLVVDEATANVDQETDAAIQETIKTCFSDRTVLTIAHRLNTIIDSDRIMVVDSGRIVEFDTPETLLGQKSSLFYSLVHGAQQTAPELMS